ncbi:hypothetical protein LTR53_011880 [Teratosphaeriaceae sp. CCFEE 6253]|nr:hypothetical protein LTR53_011880 [Teratosphaeriaceae sp. CCFEE 6253]
MSGWDDTPAAPSMDDGFQADTAGGEGFSFSDENISRHDTGDLGDAPQDGGCRVCHENGHFARDWYSCTLTTLRKYSSLTVFASHSPNAPAGSNACFNCGQDGHRSSECTNERVEREFTGDCRICSKPGHRAADCPDGEPMLCKACKQMGHKASECTMSRMIGVFSDMKIEDMPAEDAWTALMQADKTKDVHDINHAMFTYVKAYPELTFEELEKTFRDMHMNTFLIAKQQEVKDTHIIVNLQGTIDQEYVVSIQFSPKPRRAAFASGWPDTAEENLVRLSKAGVVMDRLIPKCVNCNELGHTSRNCKEERREVEKAGISCQVCNTEGHRARDCTEARKVPGKKGCRNCGNPEHIAKECPEELNMDNVECKECLQAGHFAKDCPSKPAPPCFNCGEVGHKKSECTAPRRKTDWSKVECTVCHEMGHSKFRCPQAAAEGGGSAGGDASGDAGGDGGWGDDAGGASAGGEANGGW